MADAWAWPIALGVLGAIIGSFVATIVLRWPRDESAMRGRSHCDSCGAGLRAVELVPLVSAFLQRGRCRHCGARIDPTHWQIEAMAAGIGVLAGLAVPGPEAMAGAVFGWLLLTLAALDVVALWLPDRLTVTLAVTGVVAGVAGVMPSLGERAIGGVAGFAGLWAVGAAYRLVRGREGLGGGDPKLFGAIGLWLGWTMLPAVLLLAALAGLAVALVAWIGGREVRRDTRVPFGALLAVAAYPAWLFLLGWPR